MEFVKIIFKRWSCSLIGCYVCAEYSVNTVHWNGKMVIQINHTEYINTNSWKLGKVWKAILKCNVKSVRQDLDMVDLPQEGVLWRGVVNQGMNSLSNAIGHIYSKWNLLRHCYISLNKIYSHAPHNDVSANDGPHIRRWSHKITILLLQLPSVFSTVTCCTGLQPMSNRLYHIAHLRQECHNSKFGIFELLV